MKNFRLLLAYDGTRYRGWQRQGNTGDTIQEKIEQTLARILDMPMPVEISGSGRTDAGAHARGQVANFHADTDVTPEALCKALRQYLPGDIGVLAVEEAPARFHSRLSAVRKTYCYRVWNSAVPNVFERRYVYQLPAMLDVQAMQCAASDFLGTHDYRSFCSNKHMKKSTVRTVEQFTVSKSGEEIRFCVTGDGFLYNMVRIMVGTLLEIGMHQRPADCIRQILAARTREAAGQTAPAQGLCLMEVLYE